MMDHHVDGFHLSRVCPWQLGLTDDGLMMFFGFGWRFTGWVFRDCWTGFFLVRIFLIFQDVWIVGFFRISSGISMIWILVVSQMLDVVCFKRIGCVGFFLVWIFSVFQDVWIIWFFWIGFFWFFVDVGLVFGFGLFLVFPDWIVFVADTKMVKI